MASQSIDINFDGNFYTFPFQSLCNTDLLTFLNNNSHIGVDKTYSIFANNKYASFPAIINFTDVGYVDVQDSVSFFEADLRFNALHLNCRSLNKNFEELELLINSLDSKISVIALTETWLTDEVSQLYTIKGYNLITNNRKNKIGGGIALYINEKFNYNIINVATVMCDYMESLFVEMILPSFGKCAFGCLYKPPNANNNAFLTRFDTLISNDLNNFSTKILAGDFNLDLIKNDTHKQTNDFTSLLISNGFQPLIKFPTRITEYSATCIDNFFIYSENVIVDMKSCIIVSSISDHYPIAFSFLCSAGAKPWAFYETDHNTVKKFDAQKCNNILSAYDWHYFQSECQIGEPSKMYDIFSKILTQAITESTLVTRRSTRKTPKLPWLSTGLLHSVAEKHSLYKAFAKNPTTANRQAYNSYRNKLKSLIRLAKRNYFQAKFLRSTNNCKATWKIINEILHKTNKSVTINEIIQNNNSYTKPQDIANILNEYFVNIGPNLSQQIIANPASTQTFERYLTNVKSPPNSCVFYNTDCKEIIEILKGFEPKKSCGYDNIQMSTLKLLANSIAQPICSLSNSMFRTSIFPDSLKIAKVVPIFKSGSKVDPCNYRPISLLPAVSKIFEKLIYKRLYSYLEKNNLLIDNQYGFKRNHSTTLAVLDLVDKVTTALEKKQSALGIFLDLSKAFDCIDHSILIKKLNHYGIRGHSLNLLIHYLSRRKQFVAVNGSVQSDIVNVTTGLPQGSILGPLFFIIFINDITQASKLLEFIIFADDTNLLLTHQNHEILHSLANAELKNINLWFQLNKLTLNVTKSNFIIFSCTNKHPEQISIGNIPLKEVTETKFLGVMIDSKMNWEAHIKHVCKKISPKIGLLHKIKHLLTPSLMLKLYYAFIHTHLTYSVIAWGNADNKHIGKITVLQNRVIRLARTDKSQKTITLYKDNKCLTFRDIVKMQSNMFMFKLKHNLLPTVCTKYIIDTNTTPGTTYSLRSVNSFKHGYARLKNTTRFIKYTGPKLWDQLPINLKSLNNFQTFKKSVKNVLISKYNARL